MIPAMGDFERYYQSPGIDTLEGPENSKLTKALRLLNMMVEDLNPQDFTLEEIQAEFNAGNAVAPREGGTNFGPSHLETLLEKDLIAEASEPEHYHITEKGMRFYESKANQRIRSQPENAGMSSREWLEEQGKEE